MRAERNLSRRINVICPVQSSPKKYFAFRVGQITFTTPAVLTHRGALRNVINAGRDAVDVDGAIDERRQRRTAKSCGPDTPTLGVKSAEVPPATVAKEPGHRGE